MIASGIAEHFFRREYGRLVAILCRRVGFGRLQAVEDAVQDAMLAALESWSRAGPPENPSAWLYKAAHNRLIDELRLGIRRQRLAERFGVKPPDAQDEVPGPVLAGEVQDDLLRLLFACCDDAIPLESRLVFALKTVCGFEVHEIAQRLFATDAAVYKRLARARETLLELQPRLDALTPALIASRLPTVHAVLYMMFTEGHLSSHASAPLRRELCDEARRLTQLLAEHALCGTPQTFALLALMHLHTARMAARHDGAQQLLLLEEQDRSLWDQQQIVEGLSWLARSAQGATFSRYHAEAGIAAEHCLAPSLGQTRWDRIVECYELLERVAPSALHVLGKALAVAEWRGPERGLAVLMECDLPVSLAHSYLGHAVRADLHRRCGNVETARHHQEAALVLAPSPAIRAMLERRLSQNAGLPGVTG